MKLIFALLAISISATVMADTYVRGHTTKNGTYVEPHYRSGPNDSKFDNYSTQGNTNSYTGKQGTIDPYAMPEIKPYTPPSIYQNKNPF